MTIGGLWPWYKDNIGYGKLELTELNGKTISVDVAGIMYETRYGAKQNYLRTIDPFNDPIDEDEIDRRWFRLIYKRYHKLLMNGVLPINVFDGPEDELKQTTLKERTKAQDKLRASVKTLLKEIDTLDPLLITGEHRNRYRQLLGGIEIVPARSKVRCIQFLIDIGLPYAIATGEAERTCALMNRDELVYAVLSKDGDCLACGAKLVLLKDKSGDGDSFRTAESKALLKHLGWELTKFQDLCIMSGTDFNKNIPKLGIGRSIPLLKKHGNIEGVATVRDVSIYNHVEVRKRFQIIPWQKTVSECRLEMISSNEKELTAFVTYGLDDCVDNWRLAKAIHIK